MADNATHAQATSEVERDKDPNAARMDEPLPTADDPGGAHGKGFSADAGSGTAAPPDPVPLAPGPDQHPAVRQPEREGKVQAVGRSGPGGSQTQGSGKGASANDRLTGADR